MFKIESENIVDVDISVESATLAQDAFSTICFIAVGDESIPANIVVNKLEDVLNAGWKRDSKVYNFCYGVFLQRKLNNIIVRRCLSTESYLDCYKKYNNTGYYYLVIDSKSLTDILPLATYLDNVDALKLMFFSSSEDLSSELSGIRRLVFYYLDSLDSSDEDGDFIYFDDGSIVVVDEGQKIVIEDGDGGNEVNISCENSPNYYEKSFSNIGAVYGFRSSSLLTVDLCNVDGSFNKNLFSLEYMGIEMNDDKPSYAGVNIQDSSNGKYKVLKSDDGIDIVVSTWIVSDDRGWPTYIINTDSENKRLRVRTKHTGTVGEISEFTDKDLDFYQCLSPENVKEISCDGATNQTRFSFLVDETTAKTEGMSSWIAFNSSGSQYGSEVPNLMGGDFPIWELGKFEESNFRLKWVESASQGREDGYYRFDLILYSKYLENKRVKDLSIYLTRGSVENWYQKCSISTENENPCVTQTTSNSGIWQTTDGDDFKNKNLYDICLAPME